MNETNCPKTKKTVEISFNWAVTVIVGTLLTGIISGAFSVGTILNSDHFALASNIKDTESLKSSYSNIIITLGEIKNDLGEIKGQLKYLNK